MPSFSLSTASVAVVFLSTATMSSAGGVQTSQGPGSFYSGGMVYDRAGNVLYMTGLHYNRAIDDEDMTGNSIDSESNCFLASIEMSDAGQGETFAHFDKWVSWGNPDVLETCSSMTMHNPSQLVVVGSTAPEGFFPNADPAVLLSGIVSVGSKDSLQLLSGATINSHSQPDLKLLYPMAVVSDSNNNVYVAALTSTDNALSEILGGNPSQPNWQKYTKYGSNMYMSIIKLSIREGQLKGVPKGEIDIEELWTQEFPLELEEDNVNASVSIGGLIYKVDSTGREMIVVSGSTRGRGRGYGSSAGGEEDGFLTILDPATGDLYSEITAQIRDGSPADDIITGICDDPTDATSFYIVGATKGSIGQQQADLSLIGEPNVNSLQPFIRKINLENLSEIWTLQWATKPPPENDPSSATFAYASDCAVDANGDVFVAGTIDAKASMVQGLMEHSAQGGSDVWVTKIFGESGSVDWMNQFGSSGDEEIAWYGGIVIDADGDPIIMGDTTGSMFRQRSSDDDIQTDIFVLSLDGPTGAIRNSNFIGGTSMIVEVQNEDDITTQTRPPETGDNPMDEQEEELEPLPEDQPPQNEEYPPQADQPEDIPPEVTPDHQYIPVALQIPGPAYAGGIIYDSATNSVMLSGATYKLSDGSISPNSMCFVGMVDLDHAVIHVADTYGSNELNEACSSVAYDSENDIAYTIGAAQNGEGAFAQTSDWDLPVQDSMEAGTVMQLNGRLRLMGGQRLADYAVVCPTTIETYRNYVYVASMASENPDENRAEEGDYPNFTTGGPLKYGSDFFFKIDRFAVTDVPDQYHDPLPATLEHDWEARFNIEDRGTIDVMAMELIGSQALIVVGSTNGSGGPFKDTDANDYDGWILKIDPNTGELSSVGAATSARIDSMNKQDDYIYGLCQDRHPARNMEYFYIVGSTAGKIRNLSDEEQLPEGSTHAFVARVNMDDLSAEWIKHFTMSSPDDSSMKSEALDCAVHINESGESIVYVGGTVRDGALMDGANIKESHGKDDIFVASVNGESGSINWMSQVGSDDHDSLAYGKGLEIDAFGNVIVFGETLGTIYAEHGAGEGGKDLILFTITQDGVYLDPRTRVANPPVYYGPTKRSNAPGNGALVAYGVIAGLIAVAAVTCFYQARYLKKKRAVTDKAAIFKYLQKFDVEDVDLRRSPPGGWHGTYLNKLAYGINKAAESTTIEEDIGSEAAPLTHSSVVTDSLFMESSSRPSLGLADDHDDGGEDKSARPGREVV
ncbi:hypothetical protein IV203_011801 [Nitzschia inconspicua]|uniref:Uncharacterized protein n=1 Tax=Nitzschia inconspicua TaxID=303405 RepID=A0A9K3KSG9_9STRA|nr:hypothetical protein IV203_011801 [Nitzschia inconspicua]